MRYAAIVWTVILFLGCALPQKELPQPMTLFDKFNHLAIFMLWAFLWKEGSRFSALVVFAIGTAYGILIELYQLVMPIGRACEWQDVVADSVGLMLGLAFSAYVWPRLLKVTRLG